MLALDCETTGLDLRHGARPFFVSICRSNGDQEWYEWDVDPITREPQVDKSDLLEIQKTLKNEPAILQNPKFDVAALRTVMPDMPWDWEATYDTLLAAHLLNSRQAKDLTTLCLRYLHVNLQPYEDRIKEATQQARRLAKSKFPDWRIAKPGLSEMPSAKGVVWKNDMWLPRAIATELNYAEDHPWWTVLEDYGNSDTAVLNALFENMKRHMVERGLYRIYQERLKLLPVVYKMEDAGITYSRRRLEQLKKTYIKDAESQGRVCVNIAAHFDHELELPKSGNNGSFLEFMTNKKKFNAPHIIATAYVSGNPGTVLPKPLTKTGKLSLNKAALEGMTNHLHTVEPRGLRLQFLKSFMGRRRRTTALSYMEAYDRFGLPKLPGWAILYPSLNPTGTSTLRWSSKNPNEQNISKQEGFNLRYCFGPAPGREWWSLDARNIELRLPAYEAGEQAMIDLFERPDDPPYYGSYHMLVFALLHPKEFQEHGMECKKVFSGTKYQWTKNGNFAVGYGSVEESGTADRAYHVPGAFGRVKKLFGKIHGVGGLNDQMIAHAEKHGYVETMPDKMVDPERGYPLVCERDEYGKIKPTIPLNYHIQGTAMWWMGKAMVRCQNYLNTKLGYHMVMQVHDELVFDFPKGGNEKVIQKVRRLMELGGEDIGVPTPVDIDYHPKTWAESVPI